VVGGLLDEKRVRQVVREIVVRKPRDFMGILAHFHRLVKLDVENHAARVESAVPLSPGLKDRVDEKLNRLYGAGLVLTFAENPALIGGLRIRAGNDVYDGSIQARLNALADSFETR
jgi:F-type H+-transporting ATPase subunit delta